MYRQQGEIQNFRGRGEISRQDDSVERGFSRGRYRVEGIAGGGRGSMTHQGEEQSGGDGDRLLRPEDVPTLSHRPAGHPVAGLG